MINSRISKAKKYRRSANKGGRTRDKKNVIIIALCEIARSSTIKTSRSQQPYSMWLHRKSLLQSCGARKSPWRKDYRNCRLHPPFGIFPLAWVFCLEKIGRTSARCTGKVREIWKCPKKAGKNRKEKGARVSRREREREEEAG